jgi:hypothetical protein
MKRCFPALIIYDNIIYQMCLTRRRARKKRSRLPGVGSGAVTIEPCNACFPVPATASTL